MLEERDGSGGLIVSYVYGDDLIRQKRGEAFSYYQYDGQLSTRQLTDADGNVTDTYTYDAFGDVLSQSGSTENSYLYTGEQYDPNAGFYYLRARYYDQSVGRFLTTDPWKGNVYDPLSLNKYLYTHANPVNNVDPSGKMSTLAEVSACLAVQTFLFAELYSGTAHIISESAEIEWNGPVFYVMGTVGKGYLEIGYMHAILTAKKKNGKIVKHEYAIVLSGVSAPTGADVGLISNLTIKTPGVFGYDRKVLMGLVSYTGISRTWPKQSLGIGATWVKMVMGMGRAEPSWIPDWVIGHDRDADLLIGWSQPIGS